MASGALPPSFPPVEIDGEFYWDGGIVSNTPLQYVLDFEMEDEDFCVFQIDLFSARGELPATVLEIAPAREGYSLFEPHAAEHRYDVPTAIS